MSDEIEQELPRPDAGKRKTIEKEEMAGARLNGTRGLPETKIEAPRPRRMAGVAGRKSKIVKLQRADH